MNIAQLILKCRKDFGRCGADANDMKPAGEAATALGFKHDHHPLNDAMMMYAKAFIQTHFEANHVPSGTAKREYFIEELKKAGVKPPETPTTTAAVVPIIAAAKK
jgi:hypothetical protein